MYSRRSLLAHLGIAGAGIMLTPYERFANGLVDSLIKKAYAEEVNQTPSRYYVNVFFPGGPSRFVFDHWIRTNESDPALNFNPMISTAYTSSGGRVSGLQYKTYNQSGILVPHLFSQSVRTSMGAYNLSNILSNMMAIRGFSSGIDGHQFNLTTQMAPVGGISSMSALGPDISSRPFEAVQYPERGSYNKFDSQKGKAINVLNGATPLKTLFEGLLPSAGELARASNLKARNIAAYERAQSQLKALSAVDATGAKVLKSSLDNARQLLKKGIGDIDGYWNSAVARYRGIINEAVRTQNIPGISDMPIIPAGGPQWNFAMRGSQPDLSPDQDLRSILPGLTIGSLAENFALAEFMIRGEYASSIEVHMDAGIQNVTLKNAAGAMITGNHESDMHTTGAFPAVLMMNCLYRGVLSAVAEFQQRLQSQQTSLGTNAWEDTVLHFVGDFTRVARLDGAGADHGFNQLGTSIISGAFTNGPFVTGNIQKGDVGGYYGGTVGTAAQVEDYNIKGPPRPVFAASQIAEVLRLHENPFRNLANPVVKLNGNTLNYVSSQFKGKIVG
ncbi:hypothetical protein CIK05_15505 [Bdellovibrio sp. qaytius]|nr:hypothetical protein CIK05_15505 [Bdellovibrio sp. qaytius]